MSLPSGDGEAAGPCGPISQDTRSRKEPPALDSVLTRQWRAGLAMTLVPGGIDLGPFAVRSLDATL
jgi:hypothetical protein